MGRAYEVFISGTFHLMFSGHGSETTGPLCIRFSLVAVHGLLELGFDKMHGDPKALGLCLWGAALTSDVEVQSGKAQPSGLMMGQH